MQEGRLFNMVYYLLHKGHASAPELAEKFEVSVRTIYRDIDKLSSAGIPVYAEVGRNGGIFINEDYVLDRTMFSDAEKVDLLTALQSLSATQQFDHGAFLSKLSALFNVESSDWIEVDFSRWHQGQDDNVLFDHLKSAIIHKKCLVLNYIGSNGLYSERKIAPIKLWYKSKSWYLKAYCYEKEAYRLFKLSRILEYQVLEEVYSNLPPEDFDDSENKAYRTIKLQFPKAMAYRVYDEFDQKTIKIMNNGDLLVEAQIPEDQWLIGFLLSFGPYVEIIEPLGLKEAVAEQALKIVEKNKS